LGLTEKKRKEITNQAKAEAENLLKETNARIENTIRTIIEAQASKEKTKEIRKEFENYKEKISENKFTDKIRQKNEKPLFRANKSNIKNDKTVITPTFKSGDKVRLKGQTAIGTIMELQDKQAVVAFGQLKSTVKLTQLEATTNNQLKKEKRQSDGLGTPTTDEVRQRKLTFKSEIDVRGMRGDEALQTVTYFIDDAVMVGVASVRILHGTGTGILRQLIRQYLNTVNGVISFRDEHVQFGGAGVTVVEFE